MISDESIRTVIIVHLSGDFQRTSRREMLLALAQELPVHVGMLLINRPISFDVTPLKYPRKFWSGIWRTRVRQEQNRRLLIMTPRLLAHEIIAQRWKLLVGVNRRLMASQLSAALAKYFPKAERIIQWIYHPVQDWVFETLHGAGKIYECYDEYRWRPSGEFDERTWTKEQRTLRSADLTFVTAEGLRQPREAIASRLEYVPNGVPQYFFTPGEREADEIDTIKPPLIGYLGNVRPVIDFELLEEVFRQRPEWNLVFIGPVERTAAIQDLKKLRNVHFLGARAQQQVPGLLRRLDVGLVPLRDTGFTRAMTPLKLAEYLSAGVPVVATDLPELRKFRNTVRLSPNNPAAFASAISESLALKSPDYSARLIEAARPYSWNVICRQRVIPVLDEVFHIES